MRRRRWTILSETRGGIRYHRPNAFASTKLIERFGVLSLLLCLTCVLFMFAGVRREAIILHGNGGFGGGGTVPTIAFGVHAAGIGFTWTYSDILFEHKLYVPWWLLAQLAVLYPLWWADRHIIRPKRGAGLCARCGYDLRATPDRCPACGEVPHRPTDNS